MKPIARWTIGDCSHNGLLCLRLAIKAFYKLYGDAFDYNVLYNCKNPPDLNVNLINQQDYVESLPYRPVDCCWKLYPPRLNIKVPEIFMDNDLILAKRIREIDLLVEEGIPFMTEGLGRNYGRYDVQVPANKKLNCGFFGWPVGFDFAEEIGKTCSRDDRKCWVDHYDDQGVVSSVMCRCSRYNVVPLKRLAIVGPTMKTCPKNKDGYHFVYLNRKNVDPAWRNYLSQIRMKLKI